MTLPALTVAAAGVSLARRLEVEQAPAAFLAASGCEVLAMTGRDVVAFLQTKLTQDTRPWPSTGGGFATATDINGRILFDLQAFAHPNGGWWLLLDAARAAEAAAHFDRYLISEKVELEPLGATHAVVALRGPEALTRLGVAPCADGTRAATEWRGGMLLHGSLAGAATALLVVRREAVDEATALLLGAGFLEATPAEFEALRIAAGRPRMGADDGGEGNGAIPLELGLWDAVSFRKGCYLGQEIIERLFSRSTPARRLMHIASSSTGLLPGAAVMAGAEQAGVVTGVVAAASGTEGFALVRRAFLDGSQPLEAGGAPLQLTGFVGGERPASV